MSSAIEDELCVLLQHGATIHAIKRYREVTGIPLAEAKRAVDAFMASGKLATGSSSLERATERLETDVLQTLSCHGKLTAVRLYCDRTAVTLKEAKEAVDSIAARHGVTAKRSG